MYTTERYKLFDKRVKDMWKKVTELEKQYSDFKSDDILSKLNEYKHEGGENQ